MAELFLTYEDENGETHRIPVARFPFVVGRHFDNDLPISSPKLSREHIEILRKGEEYFVEDLGSTNGTRLNDLELTRPEILFDGDVLNLGGGVKIRAEFASLDSGVRQEDETPVVADDVALDGQNGIYESGTPQPTASVQSLHVDSGYDLGKFFLIAPLLVFVVLIIAGGAFFILRGTGDRQVAVENNRDDFDPPVNDEDYEDPDVSPEPNQTPSGQPTAEPENSVVPIETSSPADSDSTPSPKIDDATVQLERAAVGFMRRIARNDPNPVITSRQLDVVKIKVNQLKGSSALSGNLSDARANAQAIRSLAQSKNLKPQFLATAALTKLGNNRGSVLGTAQGMVEVLDSLNIQIGDEVGDELLVTMAAYQQGVAGQFLQMRNTMEKLATQNPGVSSRQVRTIWFLRDKGKISNTEFEFALRFLAIGVITQNPKAFGVNQEALTL